MVFAELSKEKSRRRRGMSAIRHIKMVPKYPIHYITALLSQNILFTFKNSHVICLLQVLLLPNSFVTILLLAAISPTINADWPDLVDCDRVLRHLTVYSQTSECGVCVDERAFALFKQSSLAGSTLSTSIPRSHLVSAHSSRWIPCVTWVRLCQAERNDGSASLRTSYRTSRWQPFQSRRCSRARLLRWRGRVSPDIKMLWMIWWLFWTRSKLVQPMGKAGVFASGLQNVKKRMATSNIERLPKTKTMRRRQWQTTLRANEEKVEARLLITVGKIQEHEHHQSTIQLTTETSRESLDRQKHHGRLQAIPVQRIFRQWHQRRSPFDLIPRCQRAPRWMWIPHRVLV